MPAPSDFSQLPEDVRDWFHQRQAQNGFADLDGALAELARRGYEISRSALGRTNRFLKERTAAILLRTESTSALLTALGDKAHDIGLANVALLNDLSTEIIEKLNISGLDLAGLEPEDKLKIFLKLPTLSRDLAQSAVSHERAKAEATSRVAAVADEVASMARRGGVSDADVEAIRRKVLGLKN
jgi:hypothetical protein